MTALDREIAAWQHDRDQLAALLASQLLPDPEQVARLARIDERLRELQDEAEVEDLSREIVMAAARIHTEGARRSQCNRLG